MNIIDNLKGKMHTNRQRENAGVKAGVVRYLNKNFKGQVEITKNWGGGFTKSGRPDLEIIYNGNTYYFELKDEKGKTSTIQDSLIKRYDNLKVDVPIVFSLNQFIEIWEKIILLKQSQ